jgi:hypothetical protein
LIQQAQKAEITKRRRLKTRLKVLVDERKMRDGYQAQLNELEVIKDSKEEALRAKEKAYQSTNPLINDLEYKVCVAESEVAKWTDNTYQVVQYVQQRST